MAKTSTLNITVAKMSRSGHNRNIRAKTYVAKTSVAKTSLDKTFVYSKLYNLVSLNSNIEICKFGFW